MGWWGEGRGNKLVQGDTRKLGRTKLLKVDSATGFREQGLLVLTKKFGVVSNSLLTKGEESWISIS